MTAPSTPSTPSWHVRRRWLPTSDGRGVHARFASHRRRRAARRDDDRWYDWFDDGGCCLDVFDGWVARLSGGYTKRANSALLLYPQNDSLSDEVIGRIERLYQSHELPVIFRQLSFTTPDTFDARLEVQGRPGREGRACGAHRGRAEPR